MKINSIGASAIQVQIDGEDYSVADIVHKELLNVKHVKFAGVAPPHPLIKTLTIQIHSDGADENALLKVAAERATERLGEILEAAKKAFPDAVKARPTSPAAETKATREPSGETTASPDVSGAVSQPSVDAEPTSQ